MITPATLADGQVAASATALLSSPIDGMVNVTFCNTGVSSETLLLTVTRGSGTARQIRRDVLATNEQLVITGIRLSPADALKASASDASVVDYVVYAAPDTERLTAVAYDASGAIKQVLGSGNAAVGGTLAVTGAATFASTVAVAGLATLSAGAVVKTGGATAITTTRAITRADAGGVFTVAQSSAYTITVVQPLGAGERYLFQCVSPGAFDVSLVATGCTFEGTITIDAATIPATGSTLKFANGAAILGDSIELISTSTTKFLVRAIGSGAGGITIS